jgi:phenylacetate-coenzyme A ligase PaaK-like adenylate-forming protein
MDYAQLRQRIMSEDIRDHFEEVALSVFRYQAENNTLYRDFLRLLGRSPQSVQTLEEVPFLPISFFKTHLVQTGQWSPSLAFKSSGTTGSATSTHLVRQPGWYLFHARRGFEQQYGPLHRWCVLALLPAYLERTGSSLVYMAEDFVRASGHPSSGFFLYDTDRLLGVLDELRAAGTPTLLLGVSFALLDLAERPDAPDLSWATVMETGGMKGRRREMTRMELHALLSSAFRCQSIHSEYGMTELFSQAYAPEAGTFVPSPTLRALSRDPYDPLRLQAPGRTGGLNLVDLANLDTCSFLATDDLGRVSTDGTFEVLGRFDAADIRGCNLMA